MKKADLVAVLKAKRRAAAELDRKNLAQFKTERAAAVKARRSWLKQAAALSDDKLATYSPQVSYFKQENPMPPYPECPGCPTSWLKRLDATIADIERDYRSRFPVNDRGGLRTLLSLGEPRNNTLCSDA